MRNHYFNNRELDVLASDDHPELRKAVDLVRDLAQELLYTRMERISSRLNLTFDGNFSLGLWRAVQTGPVVISEEESTELEQLSEMSGGWWSVDNVGSPEFYTLEEWNQVYAQR